MYEDLRQSKVWRTFAKIKGWKSYTIKSQDHKSKIQATSIPINMLGLTFLKLQRSNKDPDWAELKKVIRKSRAVSTIIEPKKVGDITNFKSNRFRLSNLPYLSGKTILINLTQSKETLWKNLSENSKRLVKKNSDCKLKLVRSKSFLSLWKKYSKIWVIPEEDLKNLKILAKDKVFFALCYKNGLCQSGILILETKDTTYYYHSFTTEHGRISGAHYWLVWEILLRAKKRGQKIFDFEGIYDNRWPQKKWIGFTEFKNKFGGKEVVFPGCFVRWF